MSACRFLDHPFATLPIPYGSVLFLSPISRKLRCRDATSGSIRHVKDPRVRLRGWFRLRMLRGFRSCAFGRRFPPLGLGFEMQLVL